MTSFDTYQSIASAGEAKCNMDFHTLRDKSMLAGMFIALGCMMMLLVKSDSSLSPAISAILSGLCFSAGLFSVFVCESELFTGDCLMIFGLIEGKYGVKRMILVLLTVLFYNLVGVVIIEAFFCNAGMQNTLKDGILAVRNAKMAVGMPELFDKSVLCNFLVCLAAWINAKSTSVTEKMVAAVIPVTVFVSLGFEHSIANAFFYILMPESVDGLVLRLLVCILGNVVGGMLFFGAFQAGASINSGISDVKEGKNG